MTFRRRVVSLSAGAVAAAIAIASMAAYLMISAQLRDQVDRNLEQDVSRVSAVGLSFAGPTGPRKPDDAKGLIRVLAPGSAARQRLKFMRRPLQDRRPTRRGGSVRGGDQTRIVLPKGPLGTRELYAQIVSAGGRVARPSSDVRLPSSEAVVRVAAGKREPFFYRDEVDGVPLRVFVATIGDGLALQVARPLSEVEDMLGKLSLVFGVVTLGGIGLAIVFGLFVARAALSPVTRLTKAAENIAQTRDLAHRMEVVGDKDLDRLARSFNTMMDALEQSLNTQQQLVADASHELRTPLTSLRTNIEVLLRGDSLSPAKRRELMESVVAQIDEVTNLIGDLIDLARETETENETGEMVRLDELVEGVIQRIGHRTKGSTIRYRSEPCRLRGVPESLERAVLNLIDNAIKWAPDRSEIDVCVTGDGTVTVRDHGPGVATADAERIFDRFYRSPEARGLPGSGLGLSIVRQIAENHGGTVTVSEAPGGGALFRLDLGSRSVSPILI